MNPMCKAFGCQIKLQPLYTGVYASCPRCGREMTTAEGGWDDEKPKDKEEQKCES